MYQFFLQREVSNFLVFWSTLISRNLGQLIWTYGSATTSQGLNETEWKCSLFRFWIFFLQRLTMYLAASQNWTHSKGAVTRFQLFFKEAVTISSGTSWYCSSDCVDNNAWTWDRLSQVDLLLTLGLVGASVTLFRCHKNPWQLSKRKNQSHKKF